MTWSYVRIALIIYSNIHPRFINELADELCLPLYLIFKSSVSCAKIPKQWKFARVSAIYKKGNRKLASNYRYYKYYM